MLHIQQRPRTYFTEAGKAMTWVRCFPGPLTAKSTRTGKVDAPFVSVIRCLSKRLSTLLVQSDAE